VSPHTANAQFRPDFLWGAATSAYQFEGAWNEDGKGPSVQDARTTFPEGTSDYRVASDHYHRFAEDVALMAELGLRAYRFSIAWSRVIPDGDGPVNLAGLLFYHRLIDALVEQGIQPIVTMYHFDLPQSLEARGGWGNRATIDAFERYARVLATEFGAKVRYWLTINEQNMMILHGEAIGVAGDHGPAVDIYQQNHHMLVAQARAFAAVRELAPNSLVGPAPNIATVYPASASPADQLAADDFAAIRNWLYLDVAVRGEYNSTAWAYLVRTGRAPTVLDSDLRDLRAVVPDFIAFNYYSSHTVAAPTKSREIDPAGDQQIAVGEAGVYDGVSNPHLTRNEFGWEIDPIGFRLTLRQIWSRYRLPLIVTENGIGAFDELLPTGQVRDPYRVDYLSAHIDQMRLAVGDGVDVFGYCPWSAIDLVSTHQGVRKRYGFVYVDRDEDDLKSLARIRKDSFYWYQSLIASHGALGPE
jgi:6-phospho-beta-glucosidase